MDLAAYALGLVTATTLEGKLRPPPEGASAAAGARQRAEIDAVPFMPGRPPELLIRPWLEARTPRLGGWPDPRQRWRILHALANHELQAVELFAWALLAFPTAPVEFRSGLLGILADEQRHCRLYIERIEQLGHAFGDAPVSGYFWNKLATMSSPARFVAAMGLVFENANLDHALDAVAVAEGCGDHESAEVLRRVHRDEVRHVAFAWRWLGAFREPGQDMWDAFLEHTVWPLRPALARGRSFDRAGREAAGLDPEFIDRLEATERRRTPGPLAERPGPEPGAGPA